MDSLIDALTNSLNGLNDFLIDSAKDFLISALTGYLNNNVILHSEWLSEGVCEQLSDHLFFFFFSDQLGLPERLIWTTLWSTHRMTLWYFKWLSDRCSDRLIQRRSDWCSDRISEWLSDQRSDGPFEQLLWFFTLNDSLNDSVIDSENSLNDSLKNSEPLSSHSPPLFTFSPISTVSLMCVIYFRRDFREQDVNIYTRKNTYFWLADSGIYFIYTVYTSHCFITCYYKYVFIFDLRFLTIGSKM